MYNTNIFRDICTVAAKDMYVYVSVQIVVAVYIYIYVLGCIHNTSWGPIVAATYTSSGTDGDDYMYYTYSGINNWHFIHMLEANM
jgi:hypothetical protein